MNIKGLKVLAVLALLAVAVPAMAAKVERVQLSELGTVDYLRLFEATSEEGESLDAFAVRIAPQLVAFSDETGYEACGMLARQGDRFGVVVGTNQSHVACASFSSKVPNGMASLGESIHSHGNGAARLNRNDLRFLGLAEDPRSHRTHGMVYGQDRAQFSERDLDAGPGYLATPTGVLYQKGRGQIRTVAP